MKKILLGMFLVLQGVFAELGVESAQLLCRDLFPSTEKAKCLESVSTGKFFHEPAVNICKDIFPSSRRVECLERVKDKKYTDTAIEVCKETFITDKKIECLGSSGLPFVVAEEKKAISPVVGTKETVREEISRALHYLNQNNSGQAKMVLDNLLLKLNETL